MHQQGWHHSEAKINGILSHCQSIISDNTFLSILATSILSLEIGAALCSIRLDVKSSECLISYKTETMKYRSIKVSSPF